MHRKLKIWGRRVEHILGPIASNDRRGVTHTHTNSKVITSLLREIKGDIYKWWTDTDGYRDRQQDDLISLFFISK
jgi:hypothetical protein